MEDIRWQQRFNNYRKALQRLLDNIAYIQSKQETDEEEIDILILSMPDIEKQGLIQSFEFTYELAWKVMKDYAEFQGNTEVNGPRDAVLFAAQTGMLNDGHIWMEMMKSRNKSSHTYNEDTANEIVKLILTEYKDELIGFETKMETIRSGRKKDFG